MLYIYAQIATELWNEWYKIKLYEYFIIFLYNNLYKYILGMYVYGTLLS